MVGLVIVSHSRQLAEAACRLAKNVGNNDLPIAFAGGAGDDHQELGTDATDIMEAAQSVDSGNGVAILMDLGSAVLSAKLAQEMLADDVPDIVLCPAPLVEGAVAAAVQIASGADLKTVCAEAKNALDAKSREFDAQPDEAGPPAPPRDVGMTFPPDSPRFRFTMDDPNGMHTRPAAALVKAIAGLDCDVGIRNALGGGPFVNGKSLNQIALANIGKGDISEVAVNGRDAERALSAIRALVTDVYHGREVDTLPVVPAAPTPDGMDEKQGLQLLSPGVAVGRLALPRENMTSPEPRRAGDPEAEVKRLDDAIATVRAHLKERLATAGAGPESSLLEAQILILDDAEVLDAVRKDIRERRLDASGVYQEHMAALADRYRSLASAYMRERAADVAGAAVLVLDALAGDASGTSEENEVVAWADEAAPSLLARWNAGQLKAILTREGSPTAHIAILAKALNIPAVSGYVPPASARNGDRVAVDAGRLQVVINPTEAETTEFTGRREAWLEGIRRDLADSAGPATTRDGVAVAVSANVGDPLSVAAAVKNHAEGIGLLRTEFLFLDRRLPPDEEEQTRQVAVLLQPLADHPCIVRTLDAGGDKPMPWLALPHENNPFLGVRGVRLAMARPEAFKTQIRSILRAGTMAGVRDLRVMAPMIADIGEIAFCRKMLATAHDELTAEGKPHSWPVRFGIMVETPAAVLQVEAFARLVDFFSIGTNDLAQYLMCVERGSKALAGLSDALHPAVLTAIGMVAAGAGRHGVEVGVCGEMAGNPVSALALVGLGIRHLSMNAAAIGGVKRAIRGRSVREMEETVRTALGLPSAGKVRALFEKLYTVHGSKL